MAVAVPAQYQALVNQAASALGISPDIVAAQIQVESSFNPNATSPTGAAGLFQFEPATFAEFSSGNPYDPQTEINAYIGYMRQLLGQFGGNIQSALAAYNAGPGNIQAGMGYANQIIGLAGGGSTTSTATTDALGVSLDNSAVSAFTAVNPTLSLDALRSSAPLVAALVTSVPELQSIFQQAVAGSWSTDRFISAVQNSTWWAQNSDTMRTALATQESDPATWNQNVTNLESSLTQLAAQYGATLSQGQMNALAVDALSKGYDQNAAALRKAFEQYIQPISGLHYGGEAGTTEQAIRDFQNQMGVYLPESTLDNNIQQITGGNMSINDVEASLRSQAAAMYPAYASLINQGTSVADIAQPYISRAQQLLEGGTGMINIQSPLIKQALQYTLNGAPTPMPMSDFETQTRQDPRWLATDNAQNSIMATAHQVLQNFGLDY